MHSLIRQLLDAFTARPDELAPIVSLLEASPSLRKFDAAAFAGDTADIAKRLGALDRPDLVGSGSSSAGGTYSRMPAASSVLDEIGEELYPGGILE